MTGRTTQPRNQPTSGCPHVQEDGAYVLGALSPEDRVAFERHLPMCPDCARSVRELAGIPGLLARVPMEIVDPDQHPPPVPDTLLPSLVRRARRSERRRTWWATGLVGVAAAVAVAAVAFAALGDDDGPPSAGPVPTATTTMTATATATVSASPPPTTEPQPMQPVGAEPISGWLSLTQVGWGTRLDLTCSYATDGHEYYGEPGGSTYSLHVRTRDGGLERVASWKALPGETMQVTGATAADRDDIVRVVVRTAGGQPVLVLS